MGRNTRWTMIVFIAGIFLLFFMGSLPAATDNENINREARYIQILKSGASIQEKDKACRELQVIGTPASIPALAALLTDQDLSHMARYALEPMPYPQAGQALREALPKAKAQIKIGIINSLGFREEKESALDLIKLFKDPDVDVASAAAAALGRIGTPEAVQALEKLRKTGTGPLRAIAAEASLTAAERAWRNNRKDAALKIYDELQKAPWPVPVRQGAFLALLRFLSNEAAGQLAHAIESKDPVFMFTAIAYIPQLKDPGAALRFSSMLPKMSADAQVLMIGALADCESKKVLPAILNTLESSNQEVKLASLKALGKAGDASCVKPLSAYLSKATPKVVKKEAVGSLERLRGEDVNAELLGCLKAAPADVRTVMIEILVTRRATDAVDALFQEARGSDPLVRTEAFKALGSLGTADHLPAILELLTGLKGEEGRTEAELAAVRLARKISPPSTQADAVLNAFKGTRETTVQCSLLRVLGGIANGKSLEALRAALGSKTPEVKESALSALINWPDARAIDLMMGEWRSAASPVQKASILRGCVKLLRRGDGLPSQTLARYQALLEGAQSPEDKKFILAGLAEVADPGALALVGSCLSDPQVKSEAELSMMKISRNVMGVAAPASREAAGRLWMETQNDEVRQQAAELIREIEQTGGFLMSWQVAGPYSRMGGEGLRLFDVVFPPDKKDLAVIWRDLPFSSGTEDPWMLDLGNFLGEAQLRAAYARTWIYSETPRDAVLEIGADDPVKVWLNQEIVHLHNIPGSSAFVENRTSVTLKQGWNLLMLKIVQTGGPWKFSVKLLKPNGDQLDGVRIDAAYGEKIQTGQIYSGSAGGWVQLFNGRDLTGWRKTGDAIFSVEEGNLVGTQTDGKGGDLFTETEWDDFELRVAYRIAWPANSGFWFRAEGDKGYQFDVLKWKQPVGYSGTLYMPGKMFLTVNLNEALENRNGWNEACIRAQGDSLKLWLNGIQVGECQEPSYRKGRFGIQVHPGDEFKGMKVMVQKMEVRRLDTDSK